MNFQIVNFLDKTWLDILQYLEHDVYHLPEYLYTEGKRTNSIPQAILLSEDDKIFYLPYLLRSCNQLFDDCLEYKDIFDIVSPNGYPGILLNEVAASTPEFLKLAIQELMRVLQERKVCSAFLRLHPIINQGFDQKLSSQIFSISGETVSIDLTVSVEEIWHQTRPEHRTHINRCKRAGFIAKIVPLAEYIDDFIFIYHQTMNRVDAKKSFYFDSEYFNNLANLNEKVHLCIVELANQVACAGIFTECCGIVQYHLGGTKSEFLKQTPSKLMFDYVRLWAKERGNKVLHLGGGVGAAKDSLYNFKAGFSKQRHPFLTLRLIIDEEKYTNLVLARAKLLNTEPKTLLNSNYFPAYRSSNK
ncbi:MAG: FemAB family protein [Nodularia sp. CChRGM 3473]